MEKANGHMPAAALKEAYRTAYLVAGHINATLNEEEREELDNWINASDANMRLFGELTDEKNIETSLAAYKNMQVEEDLQKTKRQIHFKTKTRFWQYAVAASVIIALSIYIYMTQFQKDKPEIIAEVTDINPGTDKATLTLDNGTVIQLDQLANDTSITGQARILQNEGTIIYDGKSGGSELVYHTLRIPRKGHYQLQLPDGTKVWLNAESSIQYPVAFNGNERKVKVTGETYFEVAKDAGKPFKVEVGDMTVEALGTQFNINAYEDEPFVTTTLAEGSVLVTKGSTENILRPGQQAQVKDGIFKVTNADAAAVAAWKNNEFKFSDTPLDMILRQVARWYDAEIVYEDKIVAHLNARIDRNVPVSKLLYLLEQTGHVHFEVEGNTIKVRK